MQDCPTPNKSRDILCTPWLAFALFWLPGIAIASTASSSLGSPWRTVVWTASLTVMGVACVANSVRCRRVHCYLTGPFFLLMALASLLFGLGLLPLGRSGWTLIGLTILIGGIALCCLPEWFLGRYRQT